MLVSLLLLASCEHHHLYYAATKTATIEVRVDWTPALLKKLQLNGVTAVAYDNNTGDLHQIYPTFNGTDSVYLCPLPVGNYDLVFFNNTPSEYQYQKINNFSKRKTFSTSYVSREPVRPASKTEYKEIPAIYAPEILAAATVENIEVTPEQIDIFYNKPDYYYTENIHKYHVLAERKIMTWVYTAKVKGLTYAYSAPYAHLYHHRSAFLLGLDKKKTDIVLQEFVWNNRTWLDNNKQDGHIRAEFTSFGRHPYYNDKMRTLDVDFLLLDGKIHKIQVPITNEMIKDSIDRKDGVLKHWVHVEFELPTAIGDGTDSGFKPDVGEWDDVIVDL